MPISLNDSATEPTALYPINCPYCDHTFDINRRAADGTLLPIAGAELQVLPYARDVNIFDPSTGQANSPWGQIGEDFLGGLKYDRLFGILRISRELKVYYCVACCPKCGARPQDEAAESGKRGLIDVFANLTHETTPLAGIWPQIFSREKLGQLRRFAPQDLLSLLCSSYVYLVAFLLLLYACSFMPDIVTYLQQAPRSFGGFLAEHSPTLLIRGIMVLSLFFLIAVRMQLIRLFTNETAFANLFKLHDKKAVIYWMNWAVSRFTGYQEKDRLVTVNSVLFFGGFISSLILIVAWVLYTWILPSGADQTVYAMSAELAFWLPMSFLFGVIVWNQFEIPHYILPTLERIPMRAERTESFSRNFDTVIWIGIYSACGILLLCTTYIVVTMLPGLIPGFQEPQWIIVWAQFALVVFYAIIIVRFVQKHIANKVLLILAVVLAYLSLKSWVPSLGIARAVDVGQYAEMLLTFCLAAYFFFKLYGITCNSIRKTYVGEIIQEAERDAESHQDDEDPYEFNQRKEKVRHLRASANVHIISLERIKQIVAIISFLIVVATFILELLVFSKT